MSNMTISEDGNTPSPSPSQRRLRGFAIHMALYFVVMAGCVAANVLVAPGEWWFVLPLVAWGAPLGLHAGYAMGLFGGNR